MGDTRRRSTPVVDIKTSDAVRFEFGAQALLRDVGRSKLTPGESLHILSAGNIDTICYVRWMLEAYGRVDELTLCCWAISASNLCLIKRWASDGCVGRVRIILGDIYPARYKHEWSFLMGLRESGLVHSVIIGHLHCKIMLAKCGEHRIVCEGSANCNCNPRVEQAVVTDSPILFDFYDNYFDKDIKDSHLINAQWF